MAASNPWDVFGSDSDEDSSAVAKPAGPPRPPVALARVPIAKKPQRRYAWETLLPSFNFPPGFDEECGGGIAGMGGNAADGVNAEAPEAVAVTRAPFSAPPVYQHPSVRYEACLPHRGGGRGFVASDDIAPGTLLLAERRFLPMPTPEECALAGGVGPEELCLRWILELPPNRLKEVLAELRWLHPQSLEDLPESEADDLMSRHEDTAKAMLSGLREHHSATGETEQGETFGLDVKGIVRLFGALQSNGFASGIYLHPAMTNHSCRPNAIKWRAGQPISATGRRSEKNGGDDADAGEKGSMISEIRATELIREGGEITISYLEPREIALASRQSRLKDQFGFDCNCVLCEGTSNDSTNINTNSRTSCTIGNGGNAAAAAATGGAAAPLEAFLKPREDEHYDTQSTPASRVEDSGGRDPTAAQEDHGGEPHGNRAGTQESSESTRSAAGATRKDQEGPGGRVQDPEGDGGGGGEDGMGHGGEEEDEDEENRGGVVARNVLERRLEAAESVVELSRAKEVRWPGVLSEVLGYRRQASRWLSARHISLARADKLIAEACIAILQGSTETAQSDTECVQSVKQAADGLPSSFGGKPPLLSPLDGSFKTRLLAVFLAALISRRKTQLLYLGDSPHPEAGACLADLSQAMGMLLAQGSEGQKWIDRLPGPNDRQGDSNKSDTNSSNKNNNCSTRTIHSENGSKVFLNDDQEGKSDGNGVLAPLDSEEVVGEGLWWCHGGVSGASLFERECDKAARRVGRLFDAPQL